MTDVQPQDFENYTFKFFCYFSKLKTTPFK